MTRAGVEIKGKKLDAEPNINFIWLNITDLVTAHLV